MTTRNRRPGERSRRPDDANAFLPDPDGGTAYTADDLAEELAEEFLRSATGGDDAADEMREKETPEECGGPFIIRSSRSIFVRGTDESNPIDASREALPSPMRGR
jgi:hypothetical protein